MAAEQESGDDDKLRRAYAKRLQQMQMEQQKKELLKKFLTPDAYERLMNVRMANAELYSRIVDIVISLAQSGRASSKITDEQLRGILAKLTYRPEPKIEFRHK